MIPMTLDEIAAVTGGRMVNADPAAVVTGGVEYDSRKVGPGGLFVAFHGEKVDGEDRWWVAEDGARIWTGATVETPLGG